MKENVKQARKETGWTNGEWKRNGGVAKQASPLLSSEWQIRDEDWQDEVSVSPFLVLSHRSEEWDNMVHVEDSSSYMMQPIFLIIFSSLCFCAYYKFYHDSHNENCELNKILQIKGIKRGTHLFINLSIRFRFCGVCMPPPLGNLHDTVNNSPLFCFIEQTAQHALFE